MEFFKEYPALVTVIGSLAGIVLGYFLGRWSTKQDRNFNRRAVIHDMRIQEARDCLDTWAYMTDLMRHGVNVFNNKDNYESAMKELDSIAKDYSNLPLRESFNKNRSIDILNDTELTNLRDDLLSELKSPLLGLAEIEDTETLQAKKPDLDGFGNALDEVQDIIIRMKIRLDKLAKELS